MEKKIFNNSEERQVGYARPRRVWVTFSTTHFYTGGLELPREGLQMIIHRRGPQGVRTLLTYTSVDKKSISLTGQHELWYEYILPKNPDFLKIEEIAILKPNLAKS